MIIVQHRSKKEWSSSTSQVLIIEGAACIAKNLWAHLCSNLFLLKISFVYHCWW